MPQEHSFDIVSKVNLQELHNALAQAQKEIVTRFDFKGSCASIQYEESLPGLKLTADNTFQLKSIADLLETKLAKRGVSLKVFSWKEPEQLPAGSVKQIALLQQGISAEKAKEISKTIKDLGLKVQPRIEGDSVRVSAKQIDDLQSVVQAIKARDFGVALQVENYR